jgi:hypothetical protein
MAKIVFFNHYHRGDLLTHKEYIRQIKNEMPSDMKYEYFHFNHPKLTRDLDIPKMGIPDTLDHKTPFYQDGETLYINTWIGCFWDIFCQHGGINMNSLWHQWEKIFETINQAFSVELKLKEEKEFYLPSIDFSKFNVATIDEYLESNKDKGKILICNGAPKSGQSFSNNMSEFITSVAKNYPNVDFICTEKFESSAWNVLFTDDIIRDTEVEELRAPWEDREVNFCDLQEISYLSENVDAIVGKNSGPFVFCETKNNYMNPKKKFLSYNVSWGEAFHTGKKTPTETMSNSLNLKCDYRIVPISNIHDLTEDDIRNIKNSLEALAHSL